jgi:hypothetical protein
MKCIAGGAVKNLLKVSGFRAVALARITDGPSEIEIDARRSICFVPVHLGGDIHV